MRFILSGVKILIHLFKSLNSHSDNCGKLILFSNFFSLVDSWNNSSVICESLSIFRNYGFSNSKIGSITESVISLAVAVKIVWSLSPRPSRRSDDVLFFLSLLEVSWLFLLVESWIDLEFERLYSSFVLFILLWSFSVTLILFELFAGSSSIWDNIWLSISCFERCGLIST